MGYIMNILTALATIFIAIFTGFLWCSTKKLWETTEKSIDLTKQEFITSHPPKLRVHSIILHDSSVIGEKCKIQCSIDNIGGSTAKIMERNLTFTKLDPRPAAPPYGNDFPDLHIQISIEPGEGINDVLRINDDKIKDNLHRLRLEGRTDASDYYFFGYIDYLDNIGINRHIAFCRRYNIQTKRFTKVEDEDYEYSY